MRCLDLSMARSNTFIYFLQNSPINFFQTHSIFLKTKVFSNIYYDIGSLFSKIVIYQILLDDFPFIILNMSRFLSFILLSLLLISLASSQAIPTSITYIEGCFAYAQDGCCQSCEYAYTLSNGKCTRSSNVTTDCCSSYSSDGSCAQCGPGLYSSDPYCNRNQIYGCIRKSENTCIACGAGLALQNGVCFTVIPNCQNYSAIGECIACNSGFALVSSYCVAFPQVANCAQSNFYGCIQCSSGYYLTRNRTCNAFQPGCLQYFQEKCTVCLPAFSLSAGTCVIEGCAIFGATGCSQCQNGYTIDHGKCYLNNCAKSVNGTCLACQRDYRLSENGCVQAASYSCKACQTGYIFVNNHCIQIINGCITYTASNTCSSCLSNFQLTVNGLCQIIGCSVYSSSGCVNCTLPFQVSNGSCLIPNCITFGVNGCTDCSSGFFLNNGQCYPVDPNCQTYQNGVCSQCKAKYHIVNGLCIKNDRGCVYNTSGQCNCAGNFVLSSCGNCIILGCSSYDSNDNCLACQAPFTFNNGICVIPNCQTYTETSCKTCTSGYLLFNGICQLTDIYCQTYNNNGQCTNCQSGFFLSTSSGKCIKSIANCANYSDQITCQSCQTGYLLFNGQCLVPIANCQTQSSTAFTCLNCSTGYHLTQGNCTLNDANCNKYSLQNNSEFCSGCSSGYQLLQGVCIKIQPGCVYNGTMCSSCSSPFIYDASSSSCYISGCINYTLTGCLACKQPFSLLNSTCIISNCATFSQDCCLNCSNGYKLVNGKCVSIDMNCASFNLGQCTSCKNTYTLLNGKCVIKDINCDTYNTDGICLKCISSCYLDSNKRCQTKDNGCIYEGGKCKFCNPPFVLNQLANTCVIKNCLQTNSAGCTLCQNPFIIGNDNGCILPNCNIVKENACVQCKSGYHLKKGVYCEVDSYDCLSYDSDGNCQLCRAGLTLTSNAVCSALNSTCVQTSKQDKSKCLSCTTGYFLNKFYQCEKQDGKCQEYTNGVCSQCADKYFLYSQICFPYTVGCVQYSGKDCTACRSGYALKNGECFAWNQQSIGLLGSDDMYSFAITPIDVRQSKYYINNLSPGSAIGKFFFSSYFDTSYQDCSLSTLNGATGKGWKASTADSAQFVGLTITDEPVTFYAIQLEAVDGNYITEFYLEYSVDGKTFVKVQNYFTVSSSVSANMTTIYFTGIYAKAIRIKISKFQGWPACRIEFFYYDMLRFKKISNLKSLKYLQDTINSNFVDRVNNQIYINQAYFFNPVAACTSKEMCFTGLQLCQPRQINSLSLNFGQGGSVTEFYLTYSVDGRSYNCYNACAKVAVPSSANSTFNYAFNSLTAQGVRIYPTKYSGSPSFSPAFFYQ